MKTAGLWLHGVVVWALTLGLVGLSFWQWQEISRAQELAKEENSRRLTTEAELAVAEDQVRSLSESLLESEQTAARSRAERDKLERASAMLLNELKGRNKQIEALAAHFDEARGRLGAAQGLLEEATEIETAVAERDEIIRRLETERADLAKQLNERTNAYNALVKRVEAQ